MGEPMDSDFLGVGLNFPFQLDEQGQLQMAHDEESIRQAIWLILSTAPGERLMRPDFGCGLHELVFGVNNQGTTSAIEEEVRNALARWEPRIDVLDVYTAPDAAAANCLLIEINYQVRTTNSRFNLVYPFYLV